MKAAKIILAVAVVGMAGTGRCAEEATPKKEDRRVSESSIYRLSATFEQKAIKGSSMDWEFPRFKRHDCLIEFEAVVRVLRRDESGNATKRSYSVTKCQKKTAGEAVTIVEPGKLIVTELVEDRTIIIVDGVLCSKETTELLDDIVEIPTKSNTIFDTDTVVLQSEAVKIKIHRDHDWWTRSAIVKDVPDEDAGAKGRGTLTTIKSATGQELEEFRCEFHIGSNGDGVPFGITMDLKKNVVERWPKTVERFTSDRIERVECIVTSCFFLLNMPGIVRNVDTDTLTCRYEPLPLPTIEENSTPLRQLFYQTASGDWREREEASKALLQLGPEALEDLRAALRSTGDAEARKRLGAALARLEPMPVQGKFVILSNVTLRDGRPANLTNENATGTITVEKGKVTFQQTYSGGKATQIYIVPDHAPQSVSGEFEIPVKWESIQTDDAYNPDSVNPRLVYSPTADGPRLVLRFLDTKGVEGIVTCAPAEELPAAKPAGGDPRPPLEIEE